MTQAPRRILVPTDLSTCSNCAFDLAEGLAAAFGAEIHLLHVRTSVDSPVLSPDDLGQIETILASSDERTKKALEETVSTAAVPTHCLIKRGIAPVTAILNAVDELQCDLVVMGTQGRRGLKKMLLGSVAKEIIRNSPVPVLTTRVGSGAGFPPRRILVAYDASEPSLRAIRTAAAWASVLSARVTLLHVLETVAHPDFYALTAPTESQEERIVQETHRFLMKVGAEHLGEVEHEPAVIRGRAAEGIAEHASKGEFDLVILATRGLSGIPHALFGSVADRVTQLSNVPVLTVRGSSRGRGVDRSDPERPAKRNRRSRTAREPQTSFSVERSPTTTVLRLHDRKTLAGVDLRLVAGLWDFFDRENRDPRPVTVVVAPTGLFDPSSLELLVGEPTAWDGPSAVEIGRRIIREQNVIQRFVQAVRSLDSIVVGVVGGNIALQIAAPLLACDYRVIAADSVFINTMQEFPRAPLGCIPWLLTRMVGSASATRILLDLPSLSADDALALGLVNHVADSGRLEAESLAIAERIGSVNQATLFALKRAMTASADDFDTYLQEERATVERISYRAPKTMNA